MAPWIIGVCVFAGASIGYARGLKKRMEHDPSLRGKGFKVLFQK
ncbi:hypothetical protein SAMN05660282_02214 [Corynebacterium spheniscorum]|uniref:Uncharacterized protein n=1 Tax=Corynebacterium spheniscorum TaxID=185761 RepID=A0A1I2VDK2_9CORY|nr:hypothetical protein SAMN05660282_02214 [Corynebacterium spheniscorum]